MFLKKPDAVALAKRKNIRGVLKALRYKDPQVRLDAADELGKLAKGCSQNEAERISQALLKTLREDKHPGPRKYAAMALGCMGARFAVEDLLQAALDPDDDAALGAGFGLKDLNERRAAKILIERLSPRKWVLEFMEQLREPSAVDSLIKALPNYCQDLLGDEAERTLDAIDPEWRTLEEARVLLSSARENLKSSDWASRKNAVRILRILRSPSVTPALVECMIDRRNEGTEISQISQEALVVTGQSAIAPLNEAYRKLGYGEYGHENVVRALGALGQAEVIDDLIYLLHSERSFRTGEILARIGLPALDRLLSRIDVGFGRFESWKEALRALRQIGDTRAVDPLINALARHEGFGHMPEIQDIVIQLLDSLDPDWRTRESVKRNIPLFVNMLSSRNYWIRAGAVRLAISLRDPAFVGPLTDLLGRGQEINIHAPRPNGCSAEYFDSSIAKALKSIAEKQLTSS